MKITSSCGICKANIIMVAIYCYLEKEKDKVLKFHVNNWSRIKISV